MKPTKEQVEEQQRLIQENIEENKYQRLVKEYAKWKIGETYCFSPKFRKEFYNSCTVSYFTQRERGEHSSSIQWNVTIQTFILLDIEIVDNRPHRKPCCYKEPFTAYVKCLFDNGIVGYLLMRMTGVFVPLPKRSRKT